LVSADLQVGSNVVPAFNDLVTEEWLVKLLQTGGKFSGVDGSDAVVFGGGENQGFGIRSLALARLHRQTSGQTILHLYPSHLPICMQVQKNK
jgi:hypothetical protein